MYLKMTIYDLDKNIKKQEEVSVTSNSLKRVHAPCLFGKAFYHLKKDGKVECSLEDGSIIYELNEKKTLLKETVEVDLTKEKQDQELAEIVAEKY